MSKAHEKLTDLHIRRAREEDIPDLRTIAKSIGRSDNADYFTRAIKERDMYIAFLNHTVAGYVHLNFRPVYTGFQKNNIPEIQDLNVIPDARRQGIGGALVAHCENRAREKNHDHIGISVGLDSAYGAAQRLYIQRGYLPDGNGVTYDDMPVPFGQGRINDDLLTLKLIKIL